MYVIGTSFFGKSFLLYVITKRHCFKKPYCYPELLFNPHVVAFFEADVLKEIRTSFFFKLHNNSSMLYQSSKMKPLYIILVTIFFTGL